MKLWWVICALLLVSPVAFGAGHRYQLGPDDRIVVRALDVDEFPKDPIRVDGAGNINLPLIGRLHADGKTIDQLEAEITQKLKKYLKEPQVTVSIAEFRSQPVSVFGEVARPGVMQLRGPKTLWEVITEAGGFKNDAGDKIRITRRLDEGTLPLPGAHIDETGRYSIAELNTRSVMEMTNPDENILLKANDVVSVSRADVVYVVGRVNRAGGFVTSGSISLVEALSLAGGFLPNADAKKARILRVRPGSSRRQVIAVNLKKVLKGETEDVELKPQDILFVPYDGWKGLGIGLARTAVAAATGAAIYSSVRGY